MQIPDNRAEDPIPLPGTGVTNIRNTASPHWRRWLGGEMLQKVT